MNLVATGRVSLTEAKHLTDEQIVYLLTQITIDRTPADEPLSAAKALRMRYGY